jgi:hypothetical protein
MLRIGFDKEKNEFMRNLYTMYNVKLVGKNLNYEKLV